MTAYSKVGSFLIDSTKTVGQTQSITGLGFQPKAIIFFLSSITSSGTQNGISTIDLLKGGGFAVSSTERFGQVSFEADNVGTTSCSRAQTTQGCLISINATSVTGLMDLYSMDSDGFTLSVSTQFPANYRVLYFAYGGTDITNASIGTFQRPNTPGLQSVDTLGFLPDVCFFMSAKQGTVNGSVSVDGSYMFGVAGPGGQWVYSAGSNNGAALSQTLSYDYHSECIAFFDTAQTDVIGKAQFWSFDSSGFTIYWNEDTDTTQHYIAYLAISGGGWAVGNTFVYDDGGGNIAGAYSGTFDIASVLLSNVGDRNGSQDIVLNNDFWTIGGSHSNQMTDRYSLMFNNLDNQDTTDVVLCAYGDNQMGGYLAPLANYGTALESYFYIDGHNFSLWYSLGYNNFYMPYVVFGAQAVSAIIPNSITSEQNFGIFETSPFTENFPGANGSGWNPNNWIVDKV